MLKIGSSFVAGTPLELALDVDSAEHGGTTLLFTLFSGTPQATTLLSENFNGVAPGALPAGWTAAHGGGANIVPWTTRNTFCGATSNAAFHTNAADGPGPGPFTNTRFERLFSPAFVVPANADYVTIEMDVCTDTEDDPNFNILAYDGFLLRVTDLTPGRLLRSVLAEAFADQFTTGSLFHYPKHLPRGGRAVFRGHVRVGGGFAWLQARAAPAAGYGRQHRAAAFRVHAGRDRDVRRRPPGPHLRRLGRQRRCEERGVGGAVAPTPFPFCVVQPSGLPCPRSRQAEGPALR